MKVLTQIVTVFIAINLITANNTLAQQPTERDLRLMEEELAAKEAELAEKTAQVERKVAQAALQVDEQLASKVADLVNKAADLQSQEAKMQADQAAMVLQVSRLGMASALGRQGSGVLVVLTGQIEPQDIAATTEDLKIMSRIFDKKLGPAYGGLQIHTSARDYPDIDGLLRNLRRRDGSKGTQAIYLHGYAALFLMNVDFPLSAPPKVEVEKIEKDVDPLWEGTKREIATSGKTPDQDYVYLKYDSAKEYDAEKVEDLKMDLTKALRHAANIRNLKPDELIILAVAGTQQPSATIAEIKGVVEGKKTYRVIANVPTSRLFAPALLAIRAKKSDIDAYAKGQLDLDKFRERVQFLTSYVNLGPAGADQTKRDVLYQMPRM